MVTRFLTFRIRLSVSTTNASTQGFYLYNPLCGQQAKHLCTPYLMVHHNSLKHKVSYGGLCFSIVNSSKQFALLIWFDKIKIKELKDRDCNFYLFAT